MLSQEFPFGDSCDSSIRASLSTRFPWKESTIKSFAICVNTAEIKVVSDDNKTVVCRISENGFVRLASHVHIADMNGIMPAFNDDSCQRRRHIFIKQKIHDAFLIGITR